MKALYGGSVDDMFYQYTKYTPNPVLPVSRLIYNNKVEEFIKKLNALEEEYGFQIVADYSVDSDDWIEAELKLYDNVYGCVGDIVENEEDE